VPGHHVLIAGGSVNHPVRPFASSVLAAQTSPGHADLRNRRNARPRVSSPTRSSTSRGGGGGGDAYPSGLPGPRAPAGPQSRSVQRPARTCHTAHACCRHRDAARGGPLVAVWPVRLWRRDPARRAGVPRGTVHRELSTSETRARPTTHAERRGSGAEVTVLPTGSQPRTVTVPHCTPVLGRRPALSARTCRFPARAGLRHCSRPAGSTRGSPSPQLRAWSRRNSTRATFLSLPSLPSPTDHRHYDLAARSRSCRPRVACGTSTDRAVPRR